MLIFKWDKKLETGVPLLDNQHEQIFEYSNSFFIALKCGKPEQTLKECLEFLQQYVLYHFQTEEAFMVDTTYPQYRDHQAKHKALATQVKFFSVRLESTHCAPPVVEEFRAFLADWITTHIMTDDRLFCTHYREFRTLHKA